MNFFAQQDRVRRRTKWLVFYYAVAVLLTWAAIYTLCLFLMRVPFASPENFALLGGSFLSVLLIIGGGSLYKIYEMSAGGGYVASMLGGVEVDPGTSDPLERRLVNVVQEMAVASGIQVPEIYIMREEQGINAFAAGFSPQDAAIAVTRGTLEYLNRDELQGVIGHEFSHILNGDMRFNIRLIGILFGLQMITILGWFLFRNAYLFGSGSNSRDKNGAGSAGAILLFGLAVMIIGSIGAFFCSVIRAAISRQREYLADASAVQFTRNPKGIADALKKIGTAAYGSQLQNTHAMEVSHLFMASPFRSEFFAELMATHPPLKQRILAIDSSFDGNFPVRLEKIESLDSHLPLRETSPRRPMQGYAAGLSGATVGAAGATSTHGSEKPIPVADLAETRNRILKNVGQIDPGQLALAASMIDSIPDGVQSAIRDPRGAQVTVFALLLSQNTDVRTSQLKQLGARFGNAFVEITAQLSGIIDQLTPELRVPMVEMAFPTLRRLERDQYVKFRDAVEMLAKADDKIDFFEYTLQAMLLRDLDIHFSLAARLSVQYYSPKTVVDPFSDVLSLLAYAGHDNIDYVNAAYQQGVVVFGLANRILPQNACNTARLDAALRVLAQAAMPIKERMLQAFIACIWADGIVTPRERELLRAIAAMLGCPMPPLSQLVS